MAASRVNDLLVQTESLAVKRLCPLWTVGHHVTEFAALFEIW
jgi:hypothetical protein